LFLHPSLHLLTNITTLPLRWGRVRVGEDHMNPLTSILPRKGGGSFLSYFLPSLEYQADLAEFIKPNVY